MSVGREYRWPWHLASNHPARHRPGSRTAVPADPWCRPARKHEPDMTGPAGRGSNVDRPRPGRSLKQASSTSAAPRDGARNALYGSAHGRSRAAPTGSLHGVLRLRTALRTPVAPHRPSGLQPGSRRAAATILLEEMQARRVPYPGTSWGCRPGRSEGSHPSGPS